VKVDELKGNVKEDWALIQTCWKELEDKEQYQLTFTIADAGILKAVIN
jgi:hypothetical protein